MKEDLSLLDRFVQDEFSGFRGVVQAVIEWMTGYTQFVVAGQITVLGQRSCLTCFRQQLEILDDLDDEDNEISEEIPEYINPEEHLGRLVIDKFTDFEGIAIGRVIRCFAPVQLCVIPRQLTAAGQIGEIELLDLSRCRILEQIVTSKDIDD